MDSLRVKGDNVTPSVLCDADKGILEFTGRSIPENANDFFSPVMKWLTEYKSSDKNTLHVIFYLDYINSISYKMIFEMMLVVEEMKILGKEIDILWKYEEDDEEILEEGKNFATKLDLPFRFEEVPEE